MGKTWLTCALAHYDYSARYLRLPRLLEELGLAHGNWRLAKLMGRYAKTGLLILDDWGGAGSAHRRAAPRHAGITRRPLRPALDAGTSQMPVENWHGLIGDPTLADTILDRLVHNAYRIQLKGESMRKQAWKVTPPGASD